MYCARTAFEFIRKLSLVFAFIAISVALASPAHAQATLVLQQGLNSYTGAIDAKIAFDKPTTNIGGDTSNALIVDTSTALLMRYAIFQSEGGPLPNNASIISATLSLYKDWGPDAVFKANRVLKNWTELGVTWTLTGNGASWSTAGVFSGDILSTADGQGSVAAQPPVPNTQCNVDTPPFLDSCWLNIDVTSGVQAFQGGTANYGWKISFVSSNGDPSKAKEFWAKEASCCNREVRRPKLTIVYRSPPTAVLSVSPNPVAQGATVTFDAHNTTDGGSPITNLRLQFGDATPDVNWTDKNQNQTHAYGTAATYSATLTATNAIGTSPTATQSINVTGGCVPTANFTWSQTPNTLAVVFDASTSQPNGATITGLTLQFGDGQQVTWNDKNVTKSHTYAAAGTYPASLAVTNSCGTSPANGQSVVVNPIGSGPPSGTGQTPGGFQGVAVPTFHSIGLYWTPPSTPLNNTVKIRYARMTDATWKDGHDMWYDSRDTSGSTGGRSPEARGSIVHVDPGTQYVVQFGMPQSDGSVVWTAEIRPVTWSELGQPIPAGGYGVVEGSTRITTLPPNTIIQSYNNPGKGFRDAALVADQSGADGAWTVYDFTGTGAVASSQNESYHDANNNNHDRYAVVINGHHIILRGLTIQGGGSAIFIEPGSHDILIEKNNISGYGRSSGNTFQLSGISSTTYTQAIDEDGAIKLPHPSFGDASQTKRLIIQRNTFHNPIYGANPWEYDHPKGAAPMLLYPNGGNNVVRYNESFSTSDGTRNGTPLYGYFHCDGLIQGGTNDSYGGIGPDTDVYKNLVMQYQDDGLEIDGGGMNTRVWRNYFDYGGTGVSSTPCALGPCYIWRNVFNRERKLYNRGWGDDSDKVAMHKNGGIAPYNGGRAYVYHNTALQYPWNEPNRPEPYATGPNNLGAGSGISGAGGSGNEMQNQVTRNNIWDTWKSSWSAVDTTSLGTGNDFDCDMSNTSLGVTEPNGVSNTPAQYQSGNGYIAGSTGKYRLVDGSAGSGSGPANQRACAIPNFNDMYANPDKGAQQSSDPDMDFGINANGS